MLNIKNISVAIMLILSINNGKISIKEQFNTWQIEIPKINLNANISEGTTKDIMDAYVGHFSSTQTWTGNVGLAAHNRGYPVNYFQNIKDLKIGDKIIYKYRFAKKEYEIYSVGIISDEDWSFLKNTQENIITLITCVENKPNLRRCIQGKEINKI